MKKGHYTIKINRFSSVTAESVFDLFRSRPTFSLRDLKSSDPSKVGPTYAAYSPYKYVCRLLNLNILLCGHYALGRFRRSRYRKKNGLL